MTYKQGIVELIASRAKGSNRTEECKDITFYKSYIKDPKLSGHRMVTGEKKNSDIRSENDYVFEYKGKYYKITENRKIHYIGDYSVEEVSKEVYDEYGRKEE